MSDFEERMASLRQGYLSSAGARIKELSRSVSSLRGDPSDRNALRDLKQGFHRLAGSGGTYGLDAVTEIGSRGEEVVGALIESGGDPSPEDLECVASCVMDLEAAFKGARPPVSESAPSKNTSPTRDVLLVEEDPETQQVLRRALGDAGFLVRCAASCGEARKAALERFPDAIVAEILLKDGSGYDLVRWFRDQPGGGAPAVLAVSALDRFLDKVEALTCGADGFLAKPLDPADLVRRLSAILAKQQAPAARILAVEDDSDQAEFLQMVLESAGYEVQTCGDPARFESELAEFRPDLVVMDVDLPGASGIDLVRFLRQEDAYRTLPTIFLTHHAGVDQQVRALRGGGDDFITKPASPARILASVAAQVEKARLLQGLVEHDGLTGLLTHSAFLERAKGVLLRRRRNSEQVAALIMLDVDHFKSVNDRHGHPTGDRVLSALGAFLRKRLRQSDMLGRYGGEEFALLLEDLDPEAVERLVGRLLEEFASLRHRDPDGKSFCVTLSAGLACFGPGYETMEQWLSAADGALYEAKAAGRNCLRRAVAPDAADQGSPARPLAILDPILDQCRDSALLTALPVGVLLLGEEGGILWCNPSSERILGAAVGHLPGKNLATLLRDPVQEDGTPFPVEDLPSVRVLREGHPVTGTVVGWTRADGAKGWLSLNAQLLLHAGRPFLGAAVISMEDVTVRRRIHEELCKLNTAVVNSPASIVITDAKGDIEYVNPKFEEVTGYTSEEVLGRNPRILKSGMQGKAFYEQMWRELAAGRVWRSEFHNRRKDGTTYWESASISPVKNDGGRITHYVAVKEDITARKKAEEALRVNEARFRSLLDHAMNGLMAVDDAGSVESANPAAEVMFGYGSGEMPGRSLALLLPDCGGARSPGGEAPRQKSILECRALRKDGSSFSARLSLHEVERPEGRLLKIEVEDLTELQGAERAKREFVSVVSHELRTPLTSIRGSLGLLAGGVAGELPVKANELVSIALKNCQRLTMLINDILDLEKVEAGKMEFQLAPVEIMEAVQRAVEANGAYAVQFGVRLTLLGGPEGLRVRADADRLQQVLANLISNAVKFSPEGSSVELSAEVRGGGARVSVKDHGPGIGEEFREHLFHRFAQADRSDAREKGGTGLGLSICKTMVEGMGGAIGFETDPEQGTIFYFSLPRLEGGETALVEDA